MMNLKQFQSSHGMMKGAKENHENFCIGGVLA